MTVQSSSAHVQLTNGMSEHESDWTAIQNTAYQKRLWTGHIVFGLAGDVTGDPRLGCRGLKMLKQTPCAKGALVFLWGKVSRFPASDWDIRPEAPLGGSPSANQGKPIRYHPIKRPYDKMRSAAAPKPEELSGKARIWSHQAEISPHSDSVWSYLI